jgi:hydroxylamine reductase (hybrid-cluster protein)
VRESIENYPRRNKDKVLIPTSPVKNMTGFSVEAILRALGGSLTPLIDAMPPIGGSKKVTELATSGLKDVFGACFAVEPDPIKAAKLITAHIIEKRKGLGLSV